MRILWASPGMEFRYPRIKTLLYARYDLSLDEEMKHSNRGLLSETLCCLTADREQSGSALLHRVREGPLLTWPRPITFVVSMVSPHLHFQNISQPDLHIPNIAEYEVASNRRGVARPLPPNVWPDFSKLTTRYPIDTIIAINYK